MRIYLFFLCCVFVLCFGCSSKHRANKEKQISSVFPDAVVPSFPMDATVLQRISFNAIRGTSPEFIQSFILQFPWSDYRMVGVYSGFEVEYFGIDSLKDCIKNELHQGHAWEGFLSSYIFKYSRPGSLVVDVGAHIGTHTIQLSRAVGKEGRVLAIEPQPKIFRELVVNMTLNQANNIEYFWGAAGSQYSTIELDPLNIENEGGTGLYHGGTGQFVESIPLDSLHLENVSFIKIDVEGMEIEVLRGAREMILRDHPTLLVEIMGGVLPESASEEIKREILSRIQFIEEMGYEVIRVSSLWDYLALPKNSSLLQEMKNTKVYRDHVKYLKRWVSPMLSF